MTTGDERRLAWAYLSRIAEGPCAALSDLISRVGVLEAAHAVQQCHLPPVLQGATAQRRGTDCAERDLELMTRLGGRLVTPDDPEWPAWRLLGLGQLDPGRDPAAAPPLALWVRGSAALADSTELALAVVGARCNSAYGEHVTADIAGELAVRGWTIVSGAAFGIDGCAHRVTLAAGGLTVAVLACGVDRPYPAAHHRMLEQIAETGLVVSEYAPGVAPLKHHFLERNRLVAALADGVLVVEAGLRSGARNTVKWARCLGRPAMAVPGPVTASASAGCHRMIRDGEALLVTEAAQVVDEAGPLRLSVPGSTPVALDLDGPQAAVYAVLPQVGSRQPAEVAESAGLSVPATRAALAGLELTGYVKSDHSGWFRTAQAGAG